MINILTKSTLDTHPLQSADIRAVKLMC